MSVDELVITQAFKDAISFVEKNRNLIISGRAGTGKSTLLRLIVEAETDAGRAVQVVAPTGVAALNVRGQTIHKLFAFRANLSPDLRDYRPPRALRDLDLLVVDEISMARADLVDMMDLALRRARKSDEVFGGLQVVMVGDLFQLAPVVSRIEAETLLANYSTAFFFSSKAVRGLQFETVDLDHVFRQSDQGFIQLLNSIRDGSAGESEIEILNQRVVEDMGGPRFDGHVTLTTTNKNADRINQERLQEIDGPKFLSRATYGGDFDVAGFKVEEEIEFAVGAQVMMMVNAGGFVNGSVGMVESVDEQKHGALSIGIRLAETGELVSVGRHRWEILEPRKTGAGIEQHPVGFFEQVPFKLAWAITVHKSQGKTFDKVIFDRGRQVFAEGQLYVALSRCRSLEGLVLTRPVKKSDVKTSREVARFHANQTATSREVTLDDAVFVGFIETGGQQHSKIVEIAIVRGSGPSTMVFNTLVNPLRDLAQARESQLTAETVSLAPSLDEVSPILATYFDGAVVCGFGIERLLNMLAFPSGVLWGSPVDLHDFRGGPNWGNSSDALERALISRDSFLLGDNPVFGRAFSRAELVIPEGSYFLSRKEPSASGRYPRWVPICAGKIERLRLVAGDVTEVVLATSELETSAAQGPADAVARSLIRGAMRDGTMRGHEVDLISSYCLAAGIDNQVAQSDSSVDNRADEFQLVSGMRVCLTGEPARGEEHERLGKAALRKMLGNSGLVEAKSVSIKGCDLVVAFNSSSMSGKAKRARELGKPVLGAAEFVARLSTLARPEGEASPD